jgi:rhodanese-related sulfurtransferase
MKRCSRISGKNKEGGDMFIRALSLMLIILFICTAAFVVCSANQDNNMAKTNIFSSIAKKAVIKSGAKQISYDQFMRIRDAGEKYVLFDVLPRDSYDKGYIEGSMSFPLDTINEASVQERLSRSDRIIVYCASFQCAASTKAARKLSRLGYDVLDYKGGLKEWQEKGNKLVSSSK